MGRSAWLILSLTLAALAGAADKKAPPTGYTDTPFLPSGEWRVHDDARPRPSVVAPGEPTSDDPRGAAPADAVVLFDGSDLSQWRSWRGPLGAGFYANHEKGKVGDPAWNLRGGYFEAVKAGSLMSKEKFGDVQLHIEWASPAEPAGASQGRGNSGVLFFGTYEIQVLDSFNNKSYADGQAGSIYGQYPPLVNASRPPGEWQSYDIVFEAPRFEYGKLVKPAYATVFHNGVLVQHRREVLGPMSHRKRAPYRPHEAAGPLVLQDHSNPVRYRNIWARRLDLD